MKTDKEMAHEFAMMQLSKPQSLLSGRSVDGVILDAWEYIDTMNAEADKRKLSGLPDALKTADSPQLKSEVIEQILHDIDNYFDSSVSNSLRDANNVIQEIYEGLSGEKKSEGVLKFDAEKWIYERKSAYPMVDCVDGPADGFWSSFKYHPEYKGKVIYDGDIIECTV